MTATAVASEVLEFGSDPALAVMDDPARALGMI